MDANNHPGRRCPECELPEFEPTQHDVLLAAARRAREACAVPSACDATARERSEDHQPALADNARDGSGHLPNPDGPRRGVLRLRSIAEQRKLEE